MRTTAERLSDALADTASEYFVPLVASAITMAEKELDDIIDEISHTNLADDLAYIPITASATIGTRGSVRQRPMLTQLTRMVERLWRALDGQEWPRESWPLIDRWMHWCGTIDASLENAADEWIECRAEAMRCEEAHAALVRVGAHFLSTREGKRAARMLRDGQRLSIEQVSGLMRAVLEEAPDSYDGV